MNKNFAQKLRSYSAHRSMMLAVLYVGVPTLILCVLAIFSLAIFGGGNIDPAIVIYFIGSCLSLVFASALTGRIIGRLSTKSHIRALHEMIESGEHYLKLFWDKYQIYKKVLGGEIDPHDHYEMESISDYVKRLYSQSGLNELIAQMRLLEKQILSSGETWKPSVKADLKKIQNHIKKMEDLPLQAQLDAISEDAQAAEQILYQVKLRDEAMSRFIEQYVEEVREAKSFGAEHYGLSFKRDNSWD